MTDSREVQILSRSECIELLSAASVGRVVLTANALPTALPVNYVLDGGDILFRSGEGMKLSAAEAGTVVAFEVDHFDPSLRIGWSVVVTGVARVVMDAADFARADALQVPSWAEPLAGRYVRVHAGVVTGRRLAPVPHGFTAPTPVPR